MYTFIYILPGKKIHQYLLQPMLSNHWHKDHLQTAEHGELIHSKFHILCKSIQRKIVTKFPSRLMFPLALVNYRLLSGQSSYNRSHYYTNTLNSKESSKKQLTISHQPILNQSKNIFWIKKAKLRQPLTELCVNVTFLNLIS